MNLAYFLGGMLTTVMIFSVIGFILELKDYQ